MGNRKGRGAAGLPVWLQRSLQYRLTVLVLIITIPLMIGMIVFLTVQSPPAGLVNAANQTLNAANSSVSEATRLWLEYNTNAFADAGEQPGYRHDEHLWQKPMLKELACVLSLYVPGQHNRCEWDQSGPQR